MRWRHLFVDGVHPGENGARFASYTCCCSHRNLRPKTPGKSQAGARGLRECPVIFLGAFVVAVRLKLVSACFCVATRPSRSGRVSHVLSKERGKAPVFRSLVYVDINVRVGGSALP